MATDMELDLRSLYLMSVLVSLSLAGITLFFGWRDTENRAIRDWGVSTLVVAIGLAMVMLRGAVSEFLSQLLGDTLLITGATLAYRSFLVYRAEPTRDPAGWLLVLAVTGMLALGDAAIAKASLRSAIVSGVLCAQMWRISWIVGYRPLPVAVLPQRFTAGSYLLFGALFLMRTVFTLFRPPEGFSVMSISFSDAVMIGGGTVMWISATLGVMWMAIGRQQAILELLASHDPLTSALNRSAMAEAFEREKYRCSRTKGGFAVALFDIDHFKRFNDDYGHLVGDRVLKSLVQSLKGMVRQNDLVGRYGGEEFVILMPDTELSVAAQVAERASKRIEADGFVKGGRVLPLTVSAGIAEFPEHGSDWDGLLGAADSAMYRAKANGRNCIVVAEGGRGEPAPPGQTIQQFD